MKARILSFILNHKGFLFGFVLVAAVLIFVGRQTVFKPQASVQYQTAAVEKGTLISTVNASGTVATTNRMPVSTQASGQVEQILVKDGDTVSAGQPILQITLDRQGLQRYQQASTSYLQAQTSLASAQAAMFSTQSTMYSKWKAFTDIASNATYQNGDGSPNIGNRVLTQFTTVQDDWLAAEALYKNQQNVVNQAESALASAATSSQLASPTVTAPMAGTVTDLTFTTGMVISNTTNATTNTVSSQQLASIVTEANPVVQVNVAEVDVDKVKAGQKATITADAITGKTFAATVVGVNRAGVISTGVTNYPATIQLDVPTNELLPNMSVTADIITTTKQNVLLVPSAAVQTQNGQSVVRVLQKGQVQSLPVETGLSSDTQTEIVSGLSEGQTVVTGAATTGTGSSGSVFSRGFGGGGALRVGGGFGR